MFRPVTTPAEIMPNTNAAPSAWIENQGAGPGESGWARVTVRGGRPVRPAALTGRGGSRLPQVSHQPSFRSSGVSRMSQKGHKDPIIVCSCGGGRAVSGKEFVAGQAVHVPAWVS